MEGGQHSIPSNRPSGPTAARSNSTQEEEVDDESQAEQSHDIRDYTKQLRKYRKDEMDIANKTDGVKVLRRLLRKLPFQRTAEDIKIMYKALKTFTNFSSMITNKVLKELCYVAQLDSWKEDNFPVFGSSGMHMILKGSVVTVHNPHIYHPKTSLQDFKKECANNKYNLDDTKSPSVVLEVGECFGTFEAIDGQSMHKTMLMVNTKESNCEFLKITTSEYQRVIEQMSNKEQTKKLNVLQACEHFKMWTRQPKLKVANLIEWQQFAPNTVIVSEGYEAPFIGFILSGECHVLKQIEAIHTLPDGKTDHKSRQVVVGTIGPNKSFAELSLLKEEPMAYSIITSTEVTLGTISPHDLYSLDETTLELLLQSCQPTFDTLTKEKIEQEYMAQELKREWYQYRHNAVIEAINAQGIRPGYGKWKKA
ncbi:CNBD1 [Bugula neritina]|uniref:CNBD1 n=1 Tax=Bugula neritina TaxID=10212 RepID=A0A7J7J9U8_BUGNE|nr:CNBD1 [Bugula neritina]